MRTVLCLAVVLLLSTASLAAADDAGKRFRQANLHEPYRNKPIPEGATVWHCSYSGKSTIRCLLGEAGTKAITQDLLLDPKTATSPLARLIREAPETLTNQMFEIPLHTPATEFNRVGLLAESVMCGGRIDCAVIFGENTAQLEQFIRQHEVTRSSLGATTATVLPSPSK